MVLTIVFCALLLLDLLVFLEDKYVVSWIGFMAILVGVWFMFPAVQALIAPFTVIEIVGYYLGVGVGVACFKWVVANVSLYSRLRLARQAFQREPSPPNEATHARHCRFAHFWNLYYACERNSLTPRVDTSSLSQFEANPNMLVDSLTIHAKKHIDRITCWVLQWPIVVLATIGNELLINIGRTTARCFDYLFTQMSRKLVEKTVKDI